MAYDIQHYDGVVTPVSSTLPYGDVKDDVLGGDGTRVNNKSYQALHQFLMRMMNDAGITPSNTPENAVNGFQTMQALNALIANPANALAATVGAVVGNYVPVIASGMQVTTTSTSVIVTAGYFYYNGKFVQFPAQSIGLPTPGVTTAFVGLQYVDGMPTSSLSNSFISNPDNAGSFNLAHMIVHPLLTIKSEIGTPSGFGSIYTQLAAIQSIPAWINVTTFGSGWTTGGTGSVARFTQDTSGRVYMQGRAFTTSATATGNILTLPPGMSPSQFLDVTVHGTNASGIDILVGVTVTTSGVISISSTSQWPTATGQFVSLSSIPPFVVI